MKTKVHRRRFLKTTGMVAAAAGLSGLAGRRALAAPKPNGTPNAEKLGWRLGCQAYSFNQYTFFEAVDKNASIGLRYLEAYPGQKLSADNSATIGDAMSAADRKVVKQKLADAGVKLVCFGVTGASRGTFEFAKDMGIETIVSEPDFKQFDELDKLCEEFGINIALHNHPKPSRYWDPDTVLTACKGHSKRIGSCSDTGHWMRSGINPIEALKKLEGKIISLHFKDLNEMGPKGHDVPWGTGKGDVKAMLQEICRQKFKGVFSIEYEYHWKTSLPEIAKCVEYFDKVAAELAQ
jgi:sugar phosphate isomerase/epimerase